MPRSTEEHPSTDLIPYLLELGEDTDRAAHLLHDARRAALPAGLPRGVRAAVLSGDSAAVRACLAGSLVHRGAARPVREGSEAEGAPGGPVGRPRAGLTVVGIGIKLVAHASIEARMHIERADKVYYVVAEPAAGAWVRSLNYRAESLHSCLVEGQPRYEAYERMVERILGSVQRGLRVCAVFYGHPGIFVYPANEALRRAAAGGFRAEMVPGVSALDCVFADLGLDPADDGCQMFEATDFLVHRRAPDTSCAVLLLQVGLIGQLHHTMDGFNREGLRILVDVLSEHYDRSHEVILYEAAQYSICRPLIERTPLGRLPAARVTPYSTLVVPPVLRPSPDPGMLKTLGMAGPRPRPGTAGTSRG
jgi:precorrin-3B methylase